MNKNNTEYKDGSIVFLLLFSVGILIGVIIYLITHV